MQPCYDVISWLCAVITLIERYLFGFPIRGFLLFSGKSNGEKTLSRITSHFHDGITKRFLNGQTEPGATKSGRWMSRTVCRRPARWAPFFSTWPGHWPTLVSPGSLSLSFSRLPTRVRRFLSSLQKRSPFFIESGFRRMLCCHLHKRLPPSDRLPPPIFEGAAYDLAMRFQQHMP